MQHASVRLSGARRMASVRSNGRRSSGTSTRTVVKTKFSFVKTKGGKVSSSGVQKAKDAAEYYGHRPDKDGVRQYREGFNAEREDLSKHEVAKFIEEEAKKPESVYAYRMIMSPGVEMNEQQVKDWARSTLERHGISQYVAFAHAGDHAHTDHAHVHVMFMRQEKLERDDFKALRVVGDDESDKQLKAEKELDRQKVQENTRERLSQIEIGG
ncbi:relaxase/mobilization nuclease domain-containing protein [Deinococcus xianganensis]|uniref:Relaxase/mobilization nuclease n=1 Tax=Deinococcus xianganensis TaxID=1507289 RepID=A0A6I4YUB7_9DEIO|nr:relaxase/mobilization nuclease [Deinococcus xianganensis]MXV21225.1 relaxase/mobilization nuclease [Deinococcus xianganensis]